MSGREFWASLAGLAAIVTFLASLFFGRPTWLLIVVVAVMGLCAPIVWVEQKKRGYR
jgi:Flp pilus assembly protein TadB